MPIIVKLIVSSSFILLKFKYVTLLKRTKFNFISIIRFHSINTADFKTIMKHPYCNYQIAKSLIKFGQQYGNITQFDELVKSGIIPDSLFHKILPYLSLN